MPGHVEELWRGYSRAGDAYSVGFDTSELMRVVGSSEALLVPCEYSSEAQGDLILAVIFDAQERFKTELDAGASATEARSLALQVFTAGFVSVAPIIKHPKFKEEWEWRLILPVASVWDEDVRFRDGGGLLIPYIELGDGESPLPIQQVWIGPTPHPEIEQRTVDGLLYTHSLDAAVGRSEIPFRDW